MNYHQCQCIYMEILQKNSPNFQETSHNLQAPFFLTKQNSPVFLQELRGATMSCVNSVGVDLNTASPALLEHVAGLTGTLARSQWGGRVTGK